MTILIAGVMALAGAPAAVAGTYTWNQPGTFNIANPSNPDHDGYGAAPWSYAENPGGTAERLPSFESGIEGGLSGWTDPSNPNNVIAVPPSGTVSNNGDTFNSGQLAMGAASGQGVFLVWTSPFSTAQSVTFSGAVSGADSGLCLSNYTWALVQGATVLQSASSAGGISVTTTVPAGGSVYLEVANGGLLYTQACTTAEVTLGAAVSVSSAPTVKVATPSNGAIYAQPQQPTFSGTASSGFGISPKISVSVYNYTGGPPSGTPVEKLTATATTSNGATTWSVAPNPALPNGTYTVVAQQSDESSPADTGTSTQNPEFTIETPSGTSGSTGTSGTTGTSGSGGVTPPAGITVTLNAFSGPVTTGTPTFTGSSGAASAGAAVNVLVYAGTTTTSSPVKLLAGTVAANGSFSITPSDALSDGVYTALASENTTGGAAFSASITFLIKANPPALKLLDPINGTSSGPRPVFYGTAGNEAGDSATITLTLYSGPNATGAPIGSQTVTRSNGAFIEQWPAKLKLGLYTVVATQTDVAGHTTTTPAAKFIVVPNPPVIGGDMSITQNGVSSVPIYCPGLVNQSCVGNVSMVTVGKLSVGHGQRKRLTLISKALSMDGTTTLVLRGKASGAERSALRHVHSVAVKVTVTMSIGSGAAKTYTRTARAGVAH